MQRHDVTLKEIVVAIALAGRSDMWGVTSGDVFGVF